MAEHVVPLDLGITWDPNAPSAVLVSGDDGTTALALGPHPDDPDVRCVLIVWSGTRSARMSDPGDEAVSGHPLYRHGLSEVLWAGVVRDSETVRAVERQNQVHPHDDPSRFERLQHHLVLTKECVVEVVAETVEVRRADHTTLEAVASVLRR